MEFEELLKIIGGKIRWIRKTSGLNQTDFANKLDSTTATISRFEKGGRKYNSPESVGFIPLEFLFKLSKNFHQPISWIVSESPAPELPKKK